ncbi:hypothetical protein CYY_006729 [Polysphondylium violaceum]|uniref:Calponin-homology (CH) domain-containing protein n=1 Tax=Polysphondylium violaceum TaxID=133409 RepID=A0A8J4V5I5_9MYCE|nr:hypothetical protein CYY_006729 [Polysphondylium violaceum]
MSGMGTLTSRKLVSMGSFKGESNIVHTYHDEEKQSLVEHVNFLLKEDKLLKSRIPIDPKSDIIFGSLKDGIILCKLINSIKPGTINESSVKMNMVKLNIFEMNVNLEACLRGAKSIGCSIINIGPVDFQEGKRHLILSILWQLVKIDLLNKVSKLASRVKAEILDLTESEKVDDLVADEILIRWVNHHLHEAGSDRKVSNFSTDIKDCEVYITLFNQLVPETVSMDLLQEQDLLKRSSTFLECLDRIQCKKFITASDIVNANGRLNIAFIAYIFNRFNQAREEEPVVPSEIIKIANEKIAINTQEIKSLEEQIDRYQEKHLEKLKVVEEIQQKLQETKQETKELEIQFQEKLVVYETKLDTQRTEYQSQIEQLEQQLLAIQETGLPSEEELNELIAQEQLEIKLIQESMESSSIVVEFNEIEKQSQENQIQIQQLKNVQEQYQQEIEQLKSQLEQEKDSTIQQLGGTQLVETKKKLEQVKQQASEIQSQITQLKTDEKVLSNTLDETKEDRKRISLAKKKIQDQLTRAKENTEKMVKTKVETQRNIDKTTRQVKDLQGDIDRLHNDKIYIQQQTSVLRVETIEAEEQLEEIKVEKKRLLVKKSEKQQDLLEVEMELDAVLVEKDILVQDTKAKHRETIFNMKRKYEMEKKEIKQETTEISEKLIVTANQLLKQEYETESEKRHLELLQLKNRDTARDIHFETIEKQVLEKETEKTVKESEKTSQLLAQEKKINQLLEEKNVQLYKEKSLLRQENNQAANEAFVINRENREIEQKVESINIETDQNLMMAQKIELLTIETEAENEIKKAELKDEKRRLKKTISSMVEQEKELLGKIESEMGQDLIRLKAQHDLLKQDIQEKMLASEDLELKQQRFNDRISKNDKEIDSVKAKIERREKETKKAKDEKMKLETLLSQAKGKIEDIKKAKDQFNKEVEVTSTKSKLLADNLSQASKTKKTAEQSKKELEDKLAQLASLKLDSEQSHKKKIEEMEAKRQQEREKLKSSSEKDHNRLREKLEKEFKEQEEDFIKKKQSQINRTAESISKLKKEGERIDQKIVSDKEEYQLQLERKKRKEDREKLKQQSQQQQPLDDGASKQQDIDIVE